MKQVATAIGTQRAAFVFAGREGSMARNLFGINEAARFHHDGEKLVVEANEHHAPRTLTSEQILRKIQQHKMCGHELKVHIPKMELSHLVDALFTGNLEAAHRTMAIGRITNERHFDGAARLLTTNSPKLRLTLDEKRRFCRLLMVATTTT